MHRAVPILAATAVGYAVGSIPVADTVAARAGIADLRLVGDGNPGFWNARATLGVRAAVPIFVGDVAKGALAAAVGRVASSAWWSPYASGGAAMVGHAFPWAGGFRGGRSVLTFVGAATVSSPRSAAAAWATLAAVVGATAAGGRMRFDVAARVAVASFPIWQLCLDGTRRTAATGILMSFVGYRFATASPPAEDTDTTASKRAVARPGRLGSTATVEPH